MGFFDMSTGGNMGFASVKNTQNFTDDDLYDKLSGITVSFGTPIMGDIYGTPAVMYKNVTSQFDIFCRVHKKNVIMGKIGADGVSSALTAAKMEKSLLLDHKDEGSSNADRAVDELLEVIKKLEAGEEVTESTASQPAATSTGEAISLYMQQKAISIKPKFDIFDDNQTAVYHVEGDLARHSFSIQRNGQEVLKLKKKFVAIMSEFTILQDGSEIAKIKKKFKLTNPELNGQINGQELHIAGDIMGYDFDIQVGGRTIGHVDTAQTIWQDCYRIAILDESMKDIVIALAIICDNVQDQENDD
nr:hypothetical protein [Lachnospiraceae bacterium]